MEYKELDLMQLSLYNLRDVARIVGVRAPTDKKKVDLVKEIIEIKQGKREPYFTNKGRPSISRNIKVEEIEKEVVIKTIKPCHEKLKRIEELLERARILLGELLEEN